jgi:hypothetical protein
VDTAPTESAAAALARTCGRRVAVTSSTTEFTQVYANPNGRMTFESAAVPQRARKPDGAWTAIDLDLRRGADGLLRPGVSVADVRFSGGGAGPLVTLVRQGRTLTLTWLGPGLPTPTVSADTATYAAVRPGVDLVVRATRTGFTHALVVHDAAAAADPAVRKISFRIGGDATVTRAPDGSLRAMAGGRTIASTEPATMWDSAGVRASGAAGARDGSATDGSAAGSPRADLVSTAAGPGDAARVAAVATQVRGRELILTPDRSLLDAKTPTFPVFVDPPWSAIKSKWAYATSNNENNTTTHARVGNNPATAGTYRSFFDFPMSANGIWLGGRHIQSAYVQMGLYHSWNCNNAWTNMYVTGGPITVGNAQRMAWSTRWLPASFAASAQGHANKEGDVCAVQPDMTMNFIGTQVTAWAQVAAANMWTVFPVGFCACNTDGSLETAQDRFMKFHPNSAYLIVEYDSRPAQPHSTQVAGVACPAGGVGIGTLSPTFSALYPDEDGGQTLSGTYEWVEVPAAGIGAVTDTSPARKPPPPAASASANGRATTAAVSGVVAGKRYAFRVRTTDPAPYNITSPWSAWCEFWPSTTTPAAPTIGNGSVTGPGQSMTFTFSTNSTVVTKFRYGWITPPTTEVTATVSGGTATAAVTLTVPKFGKNTLWVRAIDGIGNLGNLGSRDIIAARPAPAVARWGLETYPGVTAAQALSAGGGALPLTANGVTWVAGARLIGGQTTRFNGTSTTLSPSTTVIDTSGSFMAAAWVRPEACAGFFSRAVVSMDHNAFSSFTISQSCWTGQWQVRVADRASGEPVLAEALSPSPAVPGRWTHVAGGYDELEQKIKLYVNGVLVSATTPPAAWLATRGGGFASTGPLVIGRDRWWVNGDYFQGELADVQVFNRALVDQDFTGQLASDPLSGGFDETGILAPVLVGDWSFAGAVPCYEESGVPNTCEAPEFGPFGRRMALTQGTFVGAGHRDDGLYLDDTHFVDDPSDPYYGLATQEYGRSQDNTGTPSAPVWQNGPVLRTNDSYTVSAWVMVSPDITHTGTAVAQHGSLESAFMLRYDVAADRWDFVIGDVDGTEGTGAMVSALNTAVKGTWVHLAGVYDAAAGTIRLYVNGEAQNAAAVPNPWHAGGPLVAGQRRWRGLLVEQWDGGVDDVQVFQGAMTAAAVRKLYAATVVP